MTEHTPGPWFADNLECVFTGREGDGLLICNARNSTVPKQNRPTRQQAEANARLIAAAPDLLAALEGLDKHYREKISVFDGMLSAAHPLEVARAAIAKATQ